MRKIISIVGARPQFIKAAALSRKISEHFSTSVQEILVHTGQHYDHGMSEVFFREMGIPNPAHNLAIGSGSHAVQTGRMLSGLEELMLKEKPDGVLVYGDTNSTLAGALAASKIHIPLIHVEAGLRSFNKSMPEELNRIATDHMSTLLFAPTLTGIENLENEGIKKQIYSTYTIDHPGVFHSGDVMYDNTLYYSELAEEKSDITENIKLSNDRYILATVHRPANTDDPHRLLEILEAFLEIAEDMDHDIVLPLHPRTKAKIDELADRRKVEQFTKSRKVHFIPPASFLDMMKLEKHAKLLITDSGGVQKEAWFLKKAVVILRAETEWLEIVENGNGILADSSREKIINSVSHFISSPPQHFPSLYGNGDAAGEILKILSTENWQ